MTDFLDGLGAVLVNAGTGAAKGAAMGSVVPGFGTALGAAAGAVLGAAPQISKWVFGAGAEPTIEAVKQVVDDVTGTPDPVAQVEALKDEGVASELRVRLAEIAQARDAEEHQANQAQLVAVIGDRQDSRKTMVELADRHSPLAYGAAVVSFLLLMAWFGTLLANYLGAQPLGPDDAATLRNLAIAVGAYWIGSSAGSAAKDRRAARNA